MNGKENITRRVISDKGNHDDLDELHGSYRFFDYSWKREDRWPKWPKT